MSIASSAKSRIALWGNFGTHNFGNEYTLHSVIASCQRLNPNAEVVGVSNDPSDTTRRHSIGAYPISANEPRATNLPRPFRALRHLLAEPSDWVRVIRTMRTIDMLVMSGTGMITDKHEPPMGAPYQMFKWVMAARLWRRKVSYLSVGTETLSRPIQLFWLAMSLSLAHYRSFRDVVSRNRASRLTRKVLRDRVYPDLAFSHPLPESVRTARSDGRTRVAVGIYAVEGGPAAETRYIDLIGRFIIWLLEQDFHVRVVIGDARYDEPARVALREWLTERGHLSRVVDETARSFEELIEQLRGVDLVVATRFHNLLLALLLGKPVVSVSHMDKNDELMRAMGLHDYCRDLESATVEELVRLFQDVAQTSSVIEARIAEKKAEFSNQLDEQYRSLFNLLA